MDDAQIEALLARVGALAATHHEAGGLHRLRRFERFDPLGDPVAAEQLGRALAARLAPGAHDLVVVWDGIDTSVLGYIVGRALERSVVRVYDHEGLITASAPIPAGARAVFVAPAILDPQQPRLARALMETRDATLVTVAALVDLGEPGESVVALVHVESHRPDDCPACRRGEPLTNPRVSLAPGGRNG